MFIFVPITSFLSLGSTAKRLPPRLSFSDTLVSVGLFLAGFLPCRLLDVFVCRISVKKRSLQPIYMRFQVVHVPETSVTLIYSFDVRPVNGKEVLEFYN